MSYHAQGYNPSYGSGQPYQYPPSTAQSIPPPGGNTFPGLQAHYPQPAFTQNHNLIPGLAFGNSLHNGTWQPSPPTASEPNLVPAAQYYQSVDKVGRHTGPKQNAAQSMGGAAEEGEVSEGEFDDLYEPAESTVIHHTDGADDYDPADPGWASAPTKQPINAPPIPTPSNGAAGKTFQGSPTSNRADDPRSAREWSGSYSPYLSPREIQSPANAPLLEPPIDVDPTQQTPANEEAPGKASPPLADAVSEARQKAQAAVLHLWPLHVKFSDYVEEGVDPSVLRSLFGDLGLDPSSAPPSTNSQAHGISATAAPTIRNQKNSPQPQHLTAKEPVSVTNDNASVSLADRKAEERKDRIARLWAAKATKNGLAQPSASSNQASANQTASASRPGQTEKEIKQQQKMEALQKSREARAQKAASKNGPAPKSAQPTEIATDAIGVASNNDATGSGIPGAVPHGQHPHGGRIPGLVAPDAAPTLPSTNSRKRPVAADFVDSVPTHAPKRPFGQDRGDRFVIDVSEGSEDEDVEMDMASGDEMAGLNPGSYVQRTTSFRDLPPLADAYTQRQLSSPGPKALATPPNGLAHMDKKIEEMKRMIALAEARKKLKKALNGNRKEAATANSNVPTPDASAGLSTPKPALRRVQSVDPPVVPDESATSTPGRSSPTPQEPLTSRLPKLSDLAGLALEQRERRQDRYRTLSLSLPQINGKLQAKVMKLQVLQTQVSRLEKEIAQESAEKQLMEAELNALQPILDAAESHNSAHGSAESPAESSMKSPDVTMLDHPQVTADEPTAALPEDVAITRDSGGPDVQSPQPEVPAVVAADATVVTDSELRDSQPSSTEARSEGEHLTESDAEASGQRSEEFSADLDELESPGTKMQVDDSPVGQVDNDIDGVVPLANRETDESQQATPEPQSVLGQISVGINDSRPDEGLNTAREPRKGNGDIRPPAKNPDFKPYKTPFGLFRDFRYHPSYATQVPGGLRSLTYSNKIDPNLPLCPNQLDGRQCPKGTDCEYQHFESMALPDDQILLQLGGTKLEGPERNRFNSGLRELLHDLRKQNVKDFPRIAQEIVDYHNRFSGDPSKILSLGDIPL